MYSPICLSYFSPRNSLYRDNTEMLKNCPKSPRLTVYILHSMSKVGPVFLWGGFGQALQCLPSKVTSPQKAGWLSLDSPWVTKYIKRWNERELTWFSFVFSCFALLLLVVVVVFFFFNCSILIANPNINQELIRLNRFIRISINLVVKFYKTDPKCTLTVDVDIWSTPVLFFNTGMRLLLWNPTMFWSLS